MSFAVMDVFAAKSLLVQQNFPKTFEDLSFVERMEVLAEGYGEVATEYDENGVCVSGCAYRGMRIEDEERMIERATVQLEKLIELENAKRGYDPKKIAAAQHSGHPQQVQQQQPVQQQVGGYVPPGTQQHESLQPVMPQQPTATIGFVGTPMGAVVAGAVGTAVGGMIGGMVGATMKGAQSFLGAPVRGGIKVGSDFGERRPPSTKGGNKGSRYHRGVDIKASTGTPLYSAADGKVLQAYFSKSGGNTVIIEHPFSGSDKAVQTVYMHMDTMDVKAGQTVSRGQKIGTAGNTGNSGGAHLHYAVRFDGVNVDPLGSRIKPVIDKEQQIASSTKGTNYLGEPYCIKQWISSTRLAPYQGNDEALQQNFPQCTGWCKNY
ncbi:MAG: M23 family metallopeptidase [Alphaproteobacteria bacterium]|nr:M23 family metallopeptidase [Alphaproteobacteria bacterium]